MKCVVAFVLVALVFGVVLAAPRREGMSWRESPVDSGVLSPFGFDNRPGGYSGNVDVPAAFFTWANNYCAPGGGVYQYATGPFCSPSCSSQDCPCQETGGGSYNWCGYPYPCTGYDYALSNFSYSVAEQQPGQPFIFTEYFNNYLNESQTTKFTDSQSTSNTYSWTFSRTLQDSLSISIEVGIPAECEVHDTFSTSISMTTTEEQTKTDTKTWSVSQTITIPALSTIKASMIIQTATFNVPYTAQIQMSGYAMTWCKSQVQGHYCWFIPPPYWLSSVDGCYSSDGGNATTCNFGGVFLGAQGVTATVNVSRCALGVKC